MLDAATIDAPVAQHITRDTALPVVTIGDMDNAAPIGRAGDPDTRLSLSVVVLTEGEERAPCTALCGQVRTALDGKAATVPGWSVSFAYANGTATISEDGMGYIGIILFDVIALAS